jgi:hypothetical protein
MQEDYSTRFTREALEEVDAFIATNPDYRRNGVEQPGQGATNRVVFARRDEELVVFKVFCEEERKQRECYANRHWSSTGLVPNLIWDASPRMIVMSHIGGRSLGAEREADEVPWLASYHEVGKAIGRLASVPLSEEDARTFESSFYRELGPLEAYLGRVLDLGRCIHARDPDFRAAFWGQSLEFIELQLGAILSQPRILYGQDVGNLHVQSGRFMGFFDLEMCRVGCVAMQLAASPGLDDGETWGRFRRGWEDVRGEVLRASELEAVAAARQLLGWREICRYMSYDGTPGTGYSWASPADPRQHQGAFESVNAVLGVRW